MVVYFAEAYMKTIYIIIQLFIFGLTSFADDNSLFLIYENGLYGYIDVTGKVIIEPRFKSAGEFSEGLAPVRENGYYGYIDGTGKYVISPEYDFAEKFKNGFAKVNINGNANIIDMTGDRKVHQNCNEVKDFTGFLIKIRTHSYNWGVADINGRIIIDTIYNDVSDLKDNVYIVNNTNEPPAVIDTNGIIIVAFGKYRDISNFKNGYAIVRWHSNSIDNDMRTLSWGIIDKTGKLVYSKLNSPGFHISGLISNDKTFIAYEYEYILSANKKSIEREIKIYEGIFNLEGNLIAEAPSAYELCYMDGNIYYKDSSERYYLADKNGNITKRATFFDDRDTKSSYSEVKVNEKSGIIDLSLNFIVQPEFDFILKTADKENYFKYAKYLDEGKNISNSHWDRHYKYGIGSINGKILLKPEYDEIDYYGFVNGLALVRKNGLPSYINKEGNIVWQKRKEDSSKISILNIDYQLRTDYNIRGYGWKSINGKTDGFIDIPFDNNNLSVFLEETDQIFYGKFQGINLYIINPEKKEITAPGVDAALYLVMQALDKDGQWKNIEAYPTSSCGNSYVDTEIPAEYFYKFIAPVYTGEFTTKLRARLTIGEHKNRTYIYSNIIDGNINPAQFWRNIGIWERGPRKTILEK